MLLNCSIGDVSWESLGLQGDPTSPSWRRSVLGVHWKDWCWGWNSNTLATSCEELTHWKRPWCWEGLWAGREGDDRVRDSWMASLTRWTWVWVNSGSWWWTGRPSVIWFMGSQKVRESDRTEQLNWTEAVYEYIYTYIMNYEITVYIMKISDWENFFFYFLSSSFSACSYPIFLSPSHSFSPLPFVVLCLFYFTF